MIFFVTCAIFLLFSEVSNTFFKYLVLEMTTSDKKMEDVSLIIKTL